MYGIVVLAVLCGMVSTGVIYTRKEFMSHVKSDENDGRYLCTDPKQNVTLRWTGRPIADDEMLLWTKHDVMDQVDITEDMIKSVICEKQECTASEDYQQWSRSTSLQNMTSGFMDLVLTEVDRSASGKYYGCIGSTRVVVADQCVKYEVYVGYDCDTSTANAMTLTDRPRKMMPN